MFPAQNARSGVERTNHEATGPTTYRNKGPCRKTEEFEKNGLFYSETASKVFLPHYTGGIKNTTITGHFGFVFVENTVGEIA